MVKCSSRILDRTFAALADPTRRRILEDLSHGDRCVTDLARPYSMSLPAVSKHLRVLEQARLVHGTRHGRERHWQLDGRRLNDARQYLDLLKNGRVWTSSSGPDHTPTD